MLTRARAGHRRRAGVSLLSWNFTRQKDTLGLACTPTGSSYELVLNSGATLQVDDDMYMIRTPIIDLRRLTLRPPRRRLPSRQPRPGKPDTCLRRPQLLPTSSPRDPEPTATPSPDLVAPTSPFPRRLPTKTPTRTTNRHDQRVHLPS